MTDLATSSNTARRADVLAAHSIDQVVFTVPDIAPAVAFYTAFGMDVKQHDQHVDLYTYGHPHCWMKVLANGAPKALAFITFGIFAQDEAAFRQRVDALGIGCDAHPLATRPGIWLKSPDGVALQLVVAPKVSPSIKSPADLTGKKLGAPVFDAGRRAFPILAKANGMVLPSFLA